MPSLFLVDEIEEILSRRKQLSALVDGSTVKTEDLVVGASGKSDPLWRLVGIHPCRRGFDAHTVVHPHENRLVAFHDFDADPAAVAIDAAIEMRDRTFASRRA